MTRLGERLVGVEAAGVAARSAAAGPAALHAQRLGKLSNQPVLQVEHVIQRAVRLRFGLGLAGIGIDDPRRDPQPVAGSLEAADDGAIEMQLRAQRRQSGPARRTASTTHAVDDAVAGQGAEVVRDGLGNPGRQPGYLAIAADVAEISTAIAGSPAVVASRPRPQPQSARCRSVVAVEHSAMKR